MSEITTVGLDVAKSALQVYAASADGSAILNRASRTESWSGPLLFSVCRRPSSSLSSNDRWLRGIPEEHRLPHRVFAMPIARRPRSSQLGFAGHNVASLVPPSSERQGRLAAETSLRYQDRVSLRVSSPTRPPLPTHPGALPGRHSTLITRHWCRDRPRPIALHDERRASCETLSGRTSSWPQDRRSTAARRARWLTRCPLDDRRHETCFWTGVQADRLINRY